MASKTINTGEKRTAQPPALFWAANNKELIWKMIRCLRENDFIRRGLWKKPGDAPVAVRKIILQTRLAEMVLEGTIYENAYKQDPRYYGLAVKSRLRRLQAEYQEIKKLFGETGAEPNSPGLLKAENNHDKLLDRVRAQCPYFYEIRDMLGERANVSRLTALTLHELLVGEGKEETVAKEKEKRIVWEKEERSDRGTEQKTGEDIEGGSDKETEEKTWKEIGDIEDDNSEGTAVVSARVSLESLQHDYLTEKKKDNPVPGNNCSTTPTTPLTTVHLPSRKRKPALTEFHEPLAEISESANKRKRVRDEKRIKWEREKSKLEQKRLTAKDKMDHEYRMMELRVRLAEAERAKSL